MSEYQLTRDAAGNITTRYEKMLRDLTDDVMVLATLQSSRDMCTELRKELDFAVGTGNATEAQMKDWESLVQDIAALNRVIDYYGG